MIERVGVLRKKRAEVQFSNPVIYSKRREYRSPAAEVSRGNELKEVMKRLKRKSHYLKCKFCKKRFKK